MKTVRRPEKKYYLRSWVWFINSFASWKFCVCYRWSLPCWSTRQWRSLQWWRARMWTAVRSSRLSLFSRATTGRSKVGQGYRSHLQRSRCKRIAKFGFWLNGLVGIVRSPILKKSNVYCSVFGLIAGMFLYFSQIGFDRQILHPTFKLFCYRNRFSVFSNFCKNSIGKFCKHLLQAVFRIRIRVDPHWFGRLDPD